MSRRAQENLVLFVIIALFIAMIVIGVDYVPRARLVPLPVAAIGLGLALIQLAWQNFRSTDDLHVDAMQLIAGRAENADLPTEDVGGGPMKPKPTRFSDEAAAFGMVAAVVTSFYVFGPLPTTFVFCSIYLSWSRQSSWLRALIIAAIVTASIWFLFGEVLGIRIDRSLVGPMIHRMMN